MFGWCAVIMTHTTELRMPNRAFGDDPLPLSSASTVVMVNVIGSGGGIYCIDGQNAMAVNTEIHPQNRRPDSENEEYQRDIGWSVFYIPEKGAIPEKINYHDWQAVGFTTSEACLTCGNISAGYNGEEYDCYRALTVVSNYDMGGYPPEYQFEEFPEGYVGAQYNAVFEITSEAPVSVSVVDPSVLPAGLSLEVVVIGETFRIFGTPLAAGEYTFYLRAINRFGTATKKFTIQVHDSSSLHVTPTDPEKTYIVGELIQPTDLVVTYLGNVVPWGRYSLRYNPYKTGEQMVTVLYDPNLESIGELARATYKVTYAPRTYRK